MFLVWKMCVGLKTNKEQIKGKKSKVIRSSFSVGVYSCLCGQYLWLFTTFKCNVVLTNSYIVVYISAADPHRPPKE